MEPASPAPAPAAPEPPQQRLARGQERSPKDMVMSLAVLLVPIAILMVIWRTLLSGDSPVVIDPAPKIQQAQQAGAFPVAVTQGLGDDWHVTSAVYLKEGERVTLRIGYADPDADPIQVVQSNVPPATLVPAELTDKAEPLDNFRTSAGVWRLYSARPAERALVLSEPGRTIIVIGRTDVKNLEAMATALSR